MTGTLFDIQRFSVHDGPGIRSTVFLKGCPLRCAWCQNPEGLDRTIRLWNFGNLCSRCGTCAAVCPCNALAMTQGETPKIDHSTCTRCGTCVDHCVCNALAMDGYKAEAGEVIERLLADQVFYESSGGGVTFSGGEPLEQADFVVEVATALKARGIHTALETSMAGRWERLLALTECIDFFQVDIKIHDTGRHQAATGAGNEQIQRNFAALARHLAGTDRLLVRVPLIPGYTADTANLEAIARYVASVDPTIRIELMNYNPLAVSKYRRMGIHSCVAENVTAFTETEMREMRACVVAASHA
ncbi:MAG: glycyl-radical enzyme activating protein [Planctomycetaceae bacterium]|nr:glycyl-radical enzyme activating protein [Planctomycetaceae bacterium]